mmetsp:Transcript_13315/g.15860  ORF Transcript_13315/g.15860 Transcript_13315/m.15860 type:complete len:225 (-) Transcript_13315:219-893(-)
MKCTKFLFQNLIKKDGIQVHKNLTRNNGVKTLLDSLPSNSQSTLSWISQQSYYYCKVDTLEHLMEEGVKESLKESYYLNTDWKIDESATVADAITRFVKNDISALAITNSKGAHVTGMFTMKDFMRKVASRGLNPTTTHLRDVCTLGEDTKLVSVSLQDSVFHCLEALQEHNFRHLLVRDNNDLRFIGIISALDVIKCAHDKYQEHINNLNDCIYLNELTSSPY